MQVLWNVINSRIDAYRFLKNKTVAHGLNGGLYLVLVAAECYFLNQVWWIIAVFVLSSFFNRQVTFDIPLNIRRRKTDKTITWDYMSKAQPPKAITDKIERFFFGTNGRTLHIIYILLWLATTAFLITKVFS